MNIRQILSIKPVFNRFVYITATIMAAGLFNSQVAADVPVPGYTGAAPSNTYSFSLEGCNLPDDSSGYAPPGDLVCNDSDYTPGNLGKNWEELDLVPHRLSSDSSGAAGQETFQVVVGADNLIDAGVPGAIGYNAIGFFAFDEDLSTGEATDCELALVGGNSTGDFGLGGSIEQIAQVVEITQSANTLCVWNYVERLAVTASNISGSSNRSFIVAGTGDKSVPIPSDIQPLAVGATMSAVTDSIRRWTIAKNVDPVTYDFGNTCDENVPNSKDVNIEIEFTKGAAEPFALTATGMVQLTNPSHSDVTFDCTNELFGVLTLGGTESLLADDTNSLVVAPGSTETLEFVFNVAAGALNLRSHASCDIKVLDIFTQQLVTIATLDGDVSLPNLDIGEGDVINQQVVVSDSETIAGDGFSFTTGNPTGATGSFDGYVPETVVPTNYAGPVLWNSALQSDSGTLTFTKTVTVERFKDNLQGTLADTAKLDLTDAIDVEASVETNFTAGALVNLSIDKTIPDILQGDEVIDCHFTVKNSSDVVVAEPVIHFAAGDYNKVVTIPELSPDTYTVSEGECGGLVDLAGPNRNVDLTLAGAVSMAACSATATYTNTIADGSASAQVNKVTAPAGLEDGWHMTLAGTPLSGSPFSIELTTADSDPNTYENFEDPNAPGTAFALPEGSYTVSETLKTGWHETASTGCTFSVDYPADAGKVFQCQYTNKQEGKIIIVKETDPDGGTGFGFSGDLGTFTLDDDGEKIVETVAGIYEVIEDDPTPGYDLSDITCEDDYDENGYNVIDSDDTDEAHRKAIVKLDPGETVKCTFTNRERGEVELSKLTNGVDDPTQPWSFTLHGTGVNATDGLPNPINFDGARLIPGEVYTLCETGVPAGWTVAWEVSVGGNDVPLPSGDNGLNDVGGGQMVSDVYDPNAADPDASNEDYCVDFKVAAGQTLGFRINDVPPPAVAGGQRTIGYWKNWTSCDGKGNQAENAAAHGGPDAGWWLLDDVLPLDLTTNGSFVISTCQVGVLILDKRDLAGNKRAGDSAFGLAAQLTAAMANVSAGAGTCPASTQAIASARTLLTSIGFDGSPSPSKKVKAKNTEANQLAGILDAYNNGELCP